MLSDRGGRLAGGLLGGKGALLFQISGSVFRGPYATRVDSSAERC